MEEEMVGHFVDYLNTTCGENAPLHIKQMLMCGDDDGGNRSTGGGGGSGGGVGCGGGGGVSRGSNDNVIGSPICGERASNSRGGGGIFRATGVGGDGGYDGYGRGRGAYGGPNGSDGSHFRGIGNGNGQSGYYGGTILPDDGDTACFGYVCDRASPVEKVKKAVILDHSS